MRGARVRLGRWSNRCATIAGDWRSRCCFRCWFTRRCWALRSAAKGVGVSGSIFPGSIAALTSLTFAFFWRQRQPPTKRARSLLLWWNRRRNQASIHRSRIERCRPSRLRARACRDHRSPAHKRRRRRSRSLRSRRRLQRRAARPRNRKLQRQRMLRRWMLQPRVGPRQMPKPLSQRNPQRPVGPTRRQHPRRIRRLRPRHRPRAHR